jgi:hypothetical protein
MDHNALLVGALANVPTVITVLIGILINNSRISDLSSRISGMDGRIGGLEGRITNFENKMDTPFDMLLGKVVEIDNRLTRIEAQRR